MERPWRETIQINPFSQICSLKKVVRRGSIRGPSGVRRGLSGVRRESVGGPSGVHQGVRRGVRRQSIGGLSGVRWGMCGVHPSAMSLLGVCWESTESQYIRNLLEMTSGFNLEKCSN